MEQSLRITETHVEKKTEKIQLTNVESSGIIKISGLHQTTIQRKHTKRNVFEHYLEQNNILPSLIGRITFLIIILSDSFG